MTIHQVSAYLRTPFGKSCLDLLVRILRDYVIFLFHQGNRRFLDWHAARFSREGLFGLSQLIQTLVRQAAKRVLVELTEFYGIITLSLREREVVRELGMRRIRRDIPSKVIVFWVVLFLPLMFVSALSVAYFIDSASKSQVVMGIILSSYLIVSLTTWLIAMRFRKVKSNGEKSNGS